ncbi:MAG: PIG-L family deacetylase [bacterium]|nr:PIG-L family deacetylase [bacterium]
MPEFTPQDRILILAPHPDDESIGTGGVIQKALASHAALKVALFTNGDHNEWSFIIYEKRLTVRKKEFIYMGELRRQESLAALNSLGVKRDQIVFLGYPDFGTLAIFTKYWQTKTPYRDLLTRIDHVPYNDSFSPNSAYIGENILKDLEAVISDFKPTKIFVSHPVDFNRDHQALYLFTQIALWDLYDKITPPEIFPYLVHVRGWPLPRGLYQGLPLDVPGRLKSAGINWFELGLNSAEVQKKFLAIRFYRTQIEYEPSYLISYARRNELFGNYEKIILPEQNEQSLGWENMEVPELVPALDEPEAGLSKVAYARTKDKIMVRLSLKRKIDAEFGIRVYLIGWSPGILFARMPKVQVTIGINGLEVKDKIQVLRDKGGVTYSFEDNDLIILVPVALLKYPSYILSSARTHTGDLPLGDTAWRVLWLK